jgi:folate-binding protein YgfZ
VNGEWLLESPASHAPTLLRVLDMYILRDQVELHDRTASHAFLALLGPRAGEVLAACGLPRPEVCGGDGTAVAHEPSGALLMPSRLYGAPGFDLLLPLPALDALRLRLVAAGATPVETQALQIARIEQGVPWFAEDLSQNVIPLEAGLDGYVSITKGCYPGQEVVARISNLGQVARKLVRLSATSAGGEPAALSVPAALTGSGERAGQDAGQLTSIAHDPTRRRSLALGFVRRAFWTPGTRVFSGGVELQVEGDAQA